MSPDSRKRPTTGKGKGGAAKRLSGLAPLQRLGLLVFGVSLLVLFLGFAITEGLGDPSIPDGDVAVVEDTPGDIGDVSQADYDKALLQTAARAGLREPPRPGDDQYEDVKMAAMGDILDSIWIQGEAAELGIEVTQKEIDTELESIKRQNFRTEAEYERFLEESNFTPEDVDERVKLQLLSTQIQQRITEDVPEPSQSQVEDYYEAAKSTQFTTPAVRATRTSRARPEQVQPLDEVRSQIVSQLTQQAQQEAFAAFIANYGSKWQSRTFCADDYVMERCDNYKGSGHPADAPPDCYEADPRVPPEACPAPVAQLAPALPGTVSPLTPQGQRLPQRPTPTGLRETPGAPTGLPTGLPPGVAP
ncbi:MAG TPA: SurA N-terminal domain-containing protein [Solirubrobacterales bacterium]|nr:SurA N-terminal domain-containing protein [Solirubrobacterales bacterium]